MWIREFINVVFSLALFINAALFVPQAYKVFTLKSAGDLSLITFIGFLLTQLSAIAYGYIHSDYVLLIGFLTSFITCGTVTCLIVIYRDRNVIK